MNPKRIFLQPLIISITMDKKTVSAEKNVLTPKREEIN